MRFIILLLKDPTSEFLNARIYDRCKFVRNFKNTCSIRVFGIRKNTSKFYQASTYELYGEIQEKQSEKQNFIPKVPMPL